MQIASQGGKLRDDEVSRLTSQLAAAMDAVAKLQDEIRDLQEGAATATQLTELKDRFDLIASVESKKKKPVSSGSRGGRRQMQCQMQCQMVIDESPSAGGDEVANPADARATYRNEEQIRFLTHQVASLEETIGALSRELDDAPPPPETTPTFRAVWRRSRRPGR
mmetsp:Transcript_30380/g.97942  ORF Transcript_30380/g.97942 Transcript_30380/m.97942 type:complete len:165 (+) Transcript_30380:999-1493(+)